jgi:hypothetical protein
MRISLANKSKPVDQSREGRRPPVARDEARDGAPQVSHGWRVVRDWRASKSLGSFQAPTSTGGPRERDA